MADEIVTRQQLVDAGLDAESLQKFISGLDSEDVLTRLGQIYPTLAKLVRMLMETGGWKAYSTEAELLATVPTVNPSVGYAFDTKKLYKWDGSVWIDEGLSIYDRTKPYIDVLSNTNFKQLNTFYYAPNNTIIKESNSGLFAVSIAVQAGQKYVFKTKTFGVVGSYYIADSSGNVLQTLASSETLEQDYVVTIPQNGKMLYVNCTKDYAGFKLYLLNNEIVNLNFAGLGANDFQFFSNNSGVITNTNSGFFSKSIDVSSGEFYLIRTSTYGTAPQYIIADSSNAVITLEPSGDRGKDFIIRIPSNASKLFVNCTYASRNNFKLEKVSDVLARSLIEGAFVLDYTFFYAPSNIIRKESNDSLFAFDIDVQAGQNYAINTKTFGVVGEYYITDSAGNVLQFKAADSVDEDYIITIPANAAKLYVNCTYDYADNFNVERISNALLAKIPDVDMTVRSTFPSFNYFDKLKVKCPNFYQKFKDKNEDVTVVLTGTSLTQGNLYASDRADATTRPAALHTNDLASSVFDKLIKHWDGQKYRRYDHTDLTYSNSTWVVTNNASGGIWDDYAHIKNGLTKTTTDANASVSMTIPANAWQFNFVYRSDGQCGNCTVSIAEGNSKVEAWNGSAWVEANGFVFSMYEGPATSTKGNTQYQKRLKMRCKNRASGGINSIGSTKQITISKGNNSNRFNVVGFEWSQREFMLFVINGARGGFEWGDPNGNRLDQYQDTDIWSFNPDLLLAEITIINWGASEATAMSVDPLHYVNIAKRAYFNEFNDMPTSLYAMSEAYTKCDVIFYSDTLAATSAVAGAWDSTTHEPLFGTVTTAASNGGPVDNINVGRAKTNFENYEAVERYIASKDYLFIPILSTFKAVTENYYGSYWAGMQPSDKTGETLSIDGVHFNDNGAALFSKIVASVFDEI
ncbi:hypothetical protein [Acinetobacter baumannii]|uniref:hypothetical protein n=1 Tax=Acinetobacter baumannii TaxID=470 RepID=UPI0001AF1EC5|nr:hypothetical protein [Acinetobacter baumannii]NJX41950.1 hypothetical protein [Acinetobacter baumannii]OTL46883.1 hypothetical protein B9Y02_02560 [Acinetobacter baumannii]OTN25468.1 hypothetical protein B9Y15_02400 [Acinetobacter baumannii]OTU15368.1 hypothetical protein CAT63_03470 [Acinetobacter baumannii]HEM6657605.1 hypothetical protein [Acinetobacter baumannii]